MLNHIYIFNLNIFFIFFKINCIYTFYYNYFKFMEEDSKLHDLLKNKEFKDFTSNKTLNYFFDTFLEIFFQKTKKYNVLVSNHHLFLIIN